MKTQLAYQRFEAASKNQAPDLDKKPTKDFKFGEGIPDWKIACYNLLAWSWEVLQESRDTAASVFTTEHFEQVIERIYQAGGRDACRAWVNENQGAIIDLGLTDQCREAYKKIVQ